MGIKINGKVRFGGVLASIPLFLYTDTSLWLKADNPLNTNIRWYDASPNNHVLTGTATLTDNVLNGQKGYVFNGTSNYFDGGDILDIGLNSRIMIVVGKIITETGTFYAKSLLGGVPLRYAFLKYGHYMTSICSPQTSSGINYLNTSVIFQKHTTVMDRETLTHYLYLNDTLKDIQSITTEGMNTAYNFLIGAYNNASGTTPPQAGLFLNGTICEIIFFDRLLTVLEDAYINSYLLTKYGI